MTSSERRLTYLPQLVRPAGRGAARRRDPHPLRARDGLEGRVRLRERGRDLRRVRRAHRGHAVRLLRREPRAPPRPRAARSGRCRRPTIAGTARLYTDGALSDRGRRARFVAVEHDRAGRAVRTTDYPLDAHRRAASATTGTRSPARASAGAAPRARRSRSSRSTCATRGAPASRTATSSRSRRAAARPVAQCRVSDAIREGTCFLPFHWGRRLGFYKSRQQPDASSARSGCRSSRSSRRARCAPRARGAPAGGVEAVNKIEALKAEKRRPRRHRRTSCASRREGWKTIADDDKGAAASGSGVLPAHSPRPATS